MSPRITLIMFACIGWITGCTRSDSVASDSESLPAEPREIAPLSNAWPFKDAENLSVITLTRIVDGSRRILYVVHDGDGDWQFLDGGEISESDAAIVSLKHVTELDPTVRSLADLPLGWAAERDSVEAPWDQFPR
jgi:hypothetical protein